MNKLRLYWIVSELLIVAILIVFFSSCSPERRIARILKHNPELIKIDTTWHSDTVITRSLQKDSTFHFYQKDTIFLNNDKLHIKYYFNHDSTIFLQGKCDADTVIREVPIYVHATSVKENKSFWGESNRLLLIIICSLAAIVVFCLLKR